MFEHESAVSKYARAVKKRPETCITCMQIRCARVRDHMSYGQRVDAVDSKRPYGCLALSSSACEASTDGREA